MDSYKSSYNAILEKYKKAEAWMDNKSRVDADFTPKIVEGFLSMLRELSRLEKLIEENSEWGEDEDSWLNGFK